MLDIETIRQLIAMMVANDLVEMSLRDGEEEVSLRRPGAVAAPIGPMMVPAGFAAPAAGSFAAQAGPAGVPVAANGGVDEKLMEIRSPMVGTYYSSSDPETPPFVQVGSAVSSNTVVCILEAMKVYNEIKSEITGVIERVMMKSGQPVEYGQPLFLVRPS